MGLENAFGKLIEKRTVIGQFELRKFIAQLLSSVKQKHKHTYIHIHTHILSSQNIHLSTFT